MPMFSMQPLKYLLKSSLKWDDVPILLMLNPEWLLDMESDASKRVLWTLFSTKDEPNYY